MTHAETSAAATGLRETGVGGAPRPLVRLGTFLFKRRKYVLTLTFLGVALAGRPRQLFGSASWDLVLDAAGIEIPASLLVWNVVQVIAYAIPAAAAGYYLLRNRELAA